MVVLDHHIDRFHRKIYVKVKLIDHVLFRRCFFFQKSLEKLVNYMGGRCIPQLTDHVTHLVTNNVMTKKYEVNTTIFHSNSVH